MMRGECEVCEIDAYVDHRLKWTAVEACSICN